MRSLTGKNFTPPIIKNKARLDDGINVHLGSWHGTVTHRKSYKGYVLLRNRRDSQRNKNKPIEYITFVWANDYFNSDTIEQTTTGGTRQDCDVRWQKMFNVGVEMLARGIETLSDVAPVRTFYTPSNHDEVNGYHALK